MRSYNVCVFEWLRASECAACTEGVCVKWDRKMEEMEDGGYDSLAAKVKHAVTRFIYYKICKRAAL